jgi:hypothetical protein
MFSLMLSSSCWCIAALKSVRPMLPDRTSADQREMFEGAVVNRYAPGV